MKRGEIFYINKDAGTPEVGAEIYTGRPGIIVAARHGSSTVTVVYLTTQPKVESATHVPINSARQPSTAICEQINTVDRTRVGDYFGCCTEEEMTRLDAALLIAVGVDLCERDDKRITRLEAERDAYKALVKEMIAK